MRFFLITIALTIIVIGAGYAAYAAFMRPHTYPLLTGITRVTVGDNGGAWAVCDPTQIARFVAVANRYRDGWHYVALEESMTEYGISFGHAGQPVSRIGVKIAPGLVYRQGDDFKLLTHDDPVAIWNGFLPLIQQVTNDPNIPRFTMYNITHGAPKGWFCDERDANHTHPSGTPAPAKKKSYTPLTGIDRIAISDFMGNASAVCDPAMVGKFVAVANRYRYGWRRPPWKETLTNYRIGFGQGRQRPRTTVKLSPALVYRQDDSSESLTHDSAPIWSALYPLLQEVATDPKIPKFRGYDVAHGYVKGWWCD